MSSTSLLLKMCLQTNSMSITWELVRTTDHIYWTRILRWLVCSKHIFSTKVLDYSENSWTNDSHFSVALGLKYPAPYITDRANNAVLTGETKPLGLAVQVGILSGLIRANSCFGFITHTMGVDRYTHLIKMM